MYSVYLSLNINLVRRNDLPEFIYKFYFYKRNNWKFLNEIKNSIDNNTYGFQIKTSNGIEKEGISTHSTYFKFILIKIFQQYKNNYLITYMYKTNKIKEQDYYNLNVEKLEKHSFLNTDKHYIGVFGEENVLHLGIKIIINEVGLILGTWIYEKNNKLFTKSNNKDFVLFCNRDDIYIKFRNNNYEICENEIHNNYNSIKYKLRNCLSLKNYTNENISNSLAYNFCSKYRFKIKNSDFFNYHNNYSYDINYEYEEKFSKYYFIIHLNSFIFKSIVIKLNGEEIKTLNFNKRNYPQYEINKFFLELNWKKGYILNISSKDESNFSFNIFIVKNSDYFNENKIRIHDKCEYISDTYKNYIYKIIDSLFFECIDENDIPENFYLNRKINIVLKCNKNCKRCENSYKCIECKKGYYLLNKNCIKNKDMHCDISLNYNKCSKCLDNQEFNILSKNNLNCFPDCHNGCKKCNSPLFNECLECEKDYLYYPELKQCISMNVDKNCKQGYKKLISDKNICISICFKKDELGNCISCYKNLFINKTKNECEECLIEDGYFKNYENLNFDNKPICEKCHFECKTCVDNKNKCTSCNHKKLVLTDHLKCVDKCPENYFPKKNLCIKCEKFCLNCNDEYNCLKCSENKFIKRNKCVDDCGNNYFNKDNKCVNCISNCILCKNNSECNKCEPNFYINEKKQCVECNLVNQIIVKKKCLNCSQNCKTCKNNINNCISCNENYEIKKLKNNNSICIKKCKNNYFYNLEKKKCINCKRCNICYENGILNCYNCPKCKLKCKLDIIYNDNGIIIYNKNKNNKEITFNKKYKIKNIKSKNKIIKNGIKFLFENQNSENFIVKLNHNLIDKSTNCFDLNKKIHYLNKTKLDCSIISSDIINNDNNKLFILIKTNFYFNENINLNFILKEVNRIIDYKIVYYKPVNKSNALLFIELFPNYFKNDFNILININKENIKLISFCKLINVKKIVNIKNYKTMKFKPDFEIKKDIILPVANLGILSNPEQVKVEYKSKTFNITFVLLILSVFDINNIILFFNLLQIAYIYELILLIPINFGGIANSFIKYFKIDLNNYLNINFIFKIKDQNEIQKYYFNEFLINPKITNISWLNILNIQYNVIVIIFFYLFYYSIYIIKRLFFNKIVYSSIKDYKKFKLIDKILLNLKIWKFKFIEIFKPIILSILVTYLFNINKFSLNGDNIKILVILFFYYMIVSNYLWELLNWFVYLKNNGVDYSIESKLYYHNILLLNSENKNILKNKISRYTLYQFVNNVKEFLFIMVIFVFKNFQIHVFLFLAIQFLFTFYSLFLLSRKNYNLLTKIKLFEIINLILIISIILNKYFYLNQFEISFIIFYCLVFLINTLFLLTNITRKIFIFIRLKIEKYKKYRILKLKNQ